VYDRAAMPRRVALVALLLAVLAAAARDARAAGGADPGRFLAWNAKARVVRLMLLAGLGRENNGFNFDGYGRGKLLVRVPLGWRVVVDCENRGTMRHSCAIVRGALSRVPAFRGAATQQPLTGLSPGAKATFSFVASRAGTYRIACLVDGHEQARMYDVLDVVRAARPSVAIL
jgi:sulfocyanin SoxE-like protein